MVLNGKKKKSHSFNNKKNVPTIQVAREGETPDSEGPRFLKCHQGSSALALLPPKAASLRGVPEGAKEAATWQPTHRQQSRQRNSLSLLVLQKSTERRPTDLADHTPTP